MHVETQNVIKVPAETTLKHPNVPSTGKVIRTYPNQILFAAAEMGNTKFLIELIRQYPDLIWKVNDDNLRVALQMQRELLWFQEVEAMIPPSYRDRKNKDGLTAYELFTMEHKDLVTLGESWMKETANQCMV
nr:hypothetical protein [Tanacetum cinerariifolium]